MVKRIAPMTKEEAIENIAVMRAETSKKAMQRLLQIALGPLGNLSQDARKIYQEATE